MCMGMCRIRRTSETIDDQLAELLQVARHEQSHSMTLYACQMLIVVTKVAMLNTQRLSIDRISQ